MYQSRCVLDGRDHGACIETSGTFKRWDFPLSRQRWHSDVRRWHYAVLREEG